MFSNREITKKFSNKRVLQGPAGSGCLQADAGLFCESIEDGFGFSHAKHIDGWIKLEKF